MAMVRSLAIAAAVLFLAACHSSGSKRTCDMPCCAQVCCPGCAAAKFPPSAVDHLRMSVEMEVEIFGLGKDSFTLEGTVLVHRGNGAGPDGAVMTGDLAGAELRGESKVFGKLVAIESPLQNSICEYKWLAAKKYDGYFDINGWFFLPKHDLVFFTKKPVRVAGPAEAIPPIGQVADAANVPVELFDFRKPGAPPAGSLIKARGKTLSKVNIEERLKEKGETVDQLKS